MLRTTITVVLTLALGSPLMANAGALERKKQAAINNYADQMISLFEQPAISFNTDRTLLIKDYLDPKDPLNMKLEALIADSDVLLSAMENYAVAVSTLSTTGAEDSEIVALLADELERFYKSLPADKLVIVDPPIETRINYVRNQDNYLNALEIAQPVVTAIGRYGQDLLTAYEETVSALSLSIHNEVNAEYEGVVSFKQVIDERRVEFLSRVDTEKPNAPDTEKAVIAQLNQLSRIMNVMQPYLDHYWNIQKELNDVTNEIYTNTARLKLIVLVWVRAHAQLAAGESDSEAFDVMEYKSLLKEAAQFGKDLRDA